MSKKALKAFSKAETKRAVAAAQQARKSMIQRAWDITEQMQPGIISTMAKKGYKSEDLERLFILILVKRCFELVANRDGVEYALHKKTEKEFEKLRRKFL